MGQLYTKLKEIINWFTIKRFEPFCFDPEKFAKLNARLENNSVNNIAGINGLVFQDKKISKEVLVKILDYLDYKSLIVCQLVCKQWFILIQDFIWPRKAKRLFYCPLPVNKEGLWAVFYALWDKRIPFGINLIRQDRNTFSTDPDRKKIKCQWENILGKEPIFELEFNNFKAPKSDFLFCKNSARIKISGCKSWKRQIIYLHNEGFPQSVFDNVKPIIKVSEWYRCRRDSDGVYEFKIELVKVEETVEGPLIKYDQHRNDLIHSHHFKKTFENRNHRGTWRKFKYQFRNYQKKINQIRVYHGGEGHIEMGATRVTLEFPKCMNILVRS